MSKPIRPKRRLLRFSLRSSLIVMTIMCIWIGWFVQRVERQKRAVEWGRKNGGTVYYDFQLDSAFRPLVKSQPPEPKWLRDFLGVDYMADAVAFNLAEATIHDLEPLAGLKQIRIVWAGTQVSDLTRLKGLVNLEQFVIQNSQVSDLTPLTGLVNLEILIIHNTQVSDMTPLAGLVNLRELQLGGTRITEKEFQKIKLDLPNCRVLR